MIKINLLPLNGIEIEGVGLIKLNTTKTEIVAGLGNPSHQYNKHQLYYDNYELRIDFDDNDQVEFIEFIYGPYPEKTQLSLYEINPFELKAPALLELLSLHNNGAMDDTEAECCYTFKNIAVGVWREFTSQAVETHIQEAKMNGEYDPNDQAIYDEDIEKASYFWTIGLGRAHYYG